MAFVVGLGLGVMVTSPGAEPAPTTIPESAGDPLLEASDDPGTELPDERGISEVVEGFPDALVAVARTTGSTVDYLLWPVAGDLSVRPMSGGTDVILDQTSQFVALASRLPGDSFSFLSMGRPNSIRPVAPDVDSYAFHDTTSGWLAFTTGDGVSSRVITVKSDFDPIEAVSLDEAGVTIIGWGDWGWALQRPAREILLLNPQGEFKDTEVGVGLATHESGWVFAIDGSTPKLVSAGGGVRLLEPIEGLGTIQNATFSPDGTRLAIDGERGVGVLDIGDGQFERLSEFSAGTIAWSSDGRFVLSSSGSGVLIYDLETNELHPVLRQYTVLAAGVIPLSP